MKKIVSSIASKFYRKLSIYQLILMAISFFAAISTSLMGNSFGFVLWYAVLGGITYSFYRDVKLVLLIAFTPIFLWQFGDMLYDWIKGDIADTGGLAYIGMAFAGAFITACLHTVFALVGTAIGWLIGKKKMLTIALAVLLAVGIGFVYDAFNGNPVNEWIAKRELASYLRETYPDQKFRIKNKAYNFKFSTYQFDVIEIGEGKVYSFAVRSWVPKVVEDGIRTELIDYDAIDRLGARAAAEIAELLRADVGGIKDVQVYLEIMKGELPEDVEWRRDLPLPDGFALYLTLDAAERNEADMLEIARQVQTLLNEAGYDWRSVSLNANLFEVDGEKDRGPLKYAVKFDRDTELSLGHIEKYE